MYLIMRQNKIKKERAVTNSALMFLFSLFYLLSLIYNTFLCFFQSTIERYSLYPIINNMSDDK